MMPYFLVGSTMTLSQTQQLMARGCASVWQSTVTSVPAGAPTSWLGTQIIGETAKKVSKMCCQYQLPSVYLTACIIIFCSNVHCIAWRLLHKIGFSNNNFFGALVIATKYLLLIYGPRQVTCFMVYFVLHYSILW